MGNEKRNFPRLYFLGPGRPRIKVQLGDDPDIPAELLNISTGGLCLRISDSDRLAPYRADDLTLLGLIVQNGLGIRKAPLKVCYTFRSSDLQKVVVGLHFYSSAT